MISALVALLKPLFLPVLKLDPRPPHLPEGVSLVRHLRPAEAWLGLRYAGVVLGFVVQLLTVGGVTLGLVLDEKWLAAGLMGVALLALLFVISFGLVTTRIDFELRHYLVGDRSLRVSHGAVVRQEVTLSYANVQNLEVLQGPLDRVFKIKNLVVSTAGGSDSRSGMSGSHQVTLAGITDADQLRELILGMVKQQRDQGLGDVVAHPPAALSTQALEEVRDAARALRDAARALPQQPDVPRETT